MSWLCTLFRQGQDFSPGSGQVGLEWREVQVPVPEKWTHLLCLPPLTQAVPPCGGGIST